MLRRIGVISSVVLGYLVFCNNVFAIPTFANQTGKSCSYCHNAWPQLNAQGREFKELGYRFSENVGKSASEFLEDTSLPVSGYIVARPYDKRDSGKFKNRALHEAELFVAGPIGTNMSAFVAIEYEDEIDASFGQELSAATVTYHPHRAINLQFNYGDVFWSDPYGFLSDHFRLTRSSAAVIDKTYGGADKNLRSARQNITAYGRVFDPLFYSVSLSGDADDPEGVEGTTTTYRIAYDIGSILTVGAFKMEGTKGVNPAPPAAAVERDFSRSGLDLQAEFAGFRGQFATIKGKDDTSATNSTDLKNDATSLQAMYVFTSSSDRPVFAPILRYDSYESSNGTAETNELTLNFTYYLSETMKTHIEFWDQKDVAPGRIPDSRVTVQFYLTF